MWPTGTLPTLRRAASSQRPWGRGGQRGPPPGPETPGCHAPRWAPPPTSTAQPPQAARHLVEGMTRDSVLVTRPLGGSFSVNRSREGVSTSGLSSGGAGVSPGGGVPCQGGNGLWGRPQNPREGPPFWVAAFRPPLGWQLPTCGHSCRGPRGTGSSAVPGRFLETPCEARRTHVSLSLSPTPRQGTPAFHQATQRPLLPRGGDEGPSWWFCTQVWAFEQGGRCVKPDLWGQSALTRACLRGPSQRRRRWPAWLPEPASSRARRPAEKMRITGR